MIGAIVLIDKFEKYVYIFECVGSRGIVVRFRFKGSIKSFHDTHVMYVRQDGCRLLSSLLFF